ncbi:MAG TPA: ComEA family DNA-binding protein [Anaerolineaceae bacterium]|nr:ComEA family DNA-binding protein [Chloroflexota bacterium]HNY84113.1 ComEA family DNA-binding protein [Anaerolineaceae bacterium]
MKPWQHITLGILIGLVLAGGLYLLSNLRQGDVITLVTATPKSFIEVNLAGSVKTPGVYRLAPNSRIYDAIEAAGGSVSGADLNRLNLAAFVEDGQRIFVPALSDAENAQTSHGQLNLNAASFEQLLSLPGIGEAKARAILTYRDQIGSFTALNQLLEVDGISPGLLEQLVPLLSLEP